MAGKTKARKKRRAGPTILMVYQDAGGAYYVGTMVKVDVPGLGARQGKPNAKAWVCPSEQWAEQHVLGGIW